VSGWRAAASLLTRLPMGTEPPSERDLARSVPWLPIVGAFVGLVVSGVYASARSTLPPDLAAAIAVLVGLVATGGLHEDGLADAVDSLAGGRTVDERLAILDDPRHGTYGVLALILSVLLRVLAIGGIGSASVFVVVPAAHALGRVAAATLLLVRPARDVGLGAGYRRAASRRSVLLSALVGAAIAIVSFGIWAPAVIALVGVVAWSVALVALRRIGGVTGDVLGAGEQIAEVLVLVLGAALLRRHLVDVPWWR
jgi:adenosylcobinamide-GDP ribazoletransferase